ncbi:hypothetical protein M5K25_021257 [Dendrobium thyrsiflorum]|uniref:Uncharacterized protein n=1 Tax=Dendrobium thyrsiflorum TaxID=117978 RepID=A0ABD0UBX8_DENTH
MGEHIRQGLLRSLNLQGPDLFQPLHKVGVGFAYKTIIDKASVESHPRGLEEAAQCGEINHRGLERRLSRKREGGSGGRSLAVRTASGCGGAAVADSDADLNGADDVGVQFEHRVALGRGELRKALEFSSIQRRHPGSFSRRKLSWLIPLPVSKHSAFPPFIFKLCPAERYSLLKFNADVIRSHSGRHYSQRRRHLHRRLAVRTPPLPSPPPPFTLLAELPCSSLPGLILHEQLKTRMR